MKLGSLQNIINQSKPKLIALLSHKLTIFIILGILLGWYLGNDFGNTWDEHVHKLYAEHTIEMYLGERAPRDTVRDLRFYGPAFNVPWLLVRNIFTRIFSSWSRADAGHFIYWLAFLPAPLFFYGLSRRYSNRAASFAAMLLFVTQPAIFGHAFVNPKDVPFMTAFLGALWLGLLAIDYSVEKDRWWSIDSIPSKLLNGLGVTVESLKASSIWRKLAVLILWSLAILASIDLLIGHRLLQGIFLLIEQAYEGHAIQPVQTLFNLVAQDAYKTAISEYLAKARLFYTWARFLVLFLIFGISIHFSLKLLGVSLPKKWLSSARTWWTWFAAAGLLGVSSAIRVFGPFVGLLVVTHAFIRLKRRAWLPVLSYASVSMLIFYASWPTLWGSPVKNLSETISLMSRFPWPGRVLYAGQSYSVTELPWHYELGVFALRLTIPALGLAVVGISVVGYKILAKREGFKRFWLPLIWIGLPLATVILFDVQIYGAFRQLLFLIPPIFIFASIGFQKVFQILSNEFWPPVLITIALIPSLIGIIRLHPYEIIYYNEIVGGTAGAAGRYELETWGTTYREIVEYLNEVAPQGSQVLVNAHEFHTMTPFARDDLQLGTLNSTSIHPSVPKTYVVDGENYFEDIQGKTIFVVERDGIPLGSIQVLR